MRYWVVVKRGQPEVLELLTQAFGNRPLFAVIEDERRYPSDAFPGPERRCGGELWTSLGFTVRKCLDSASDDCR